MFLIGPESVGNMLYIFMTHAQQRAIYDLVFGLSTHSFDFGRVLSGEGVNIILFS